MAKPWYKRLYRYLAQYGDEVPTLIVATPLVHSETPKPVTVVVPARELAAVVKKARKKTAKKLRS